MFDQLLNLQNGVTQEGMNLIKAMETSPSTAGTNSTGAAPNFLDPFKREFVSDIVTSLIATEQDIKFTNLLHQDFTPTHYYQYLRETGLGDMDAYGAFSQQLSVPEKIYPNYDRNFVSLKFSYDRKSLSLASQSEYYYNITNAYDELARKALTAMLIRENKCFIYGNSTIDSLGFDGIFKAHQFRNGAYLTPTAYSQLEEVIDLRGGKLNYDIISNAENIIFRHYARNQKKALVMPTLSIEGISSKDFSATPMRWITENGISKPVYSDYIAQIQTKAGRQVEFHTDLFISREQVFGTWLIADPSQIISVTAPVTPNVSAGTNAAVNDASSLFTSAWYGDYYYAVSAVGSTGVSKLALINATPVTVIAGKSVELTFTSGSGTYPESGYIIWRSEKNAAHANGLYYPLFTVTATELANGYDGAGSTKVWDRNRTIPKTEDCFMVGMESGADILDKQVIRRLELSSNFLSGIKRYDIPVGFSGSFAGGQPSMTSMICHHLALALPAPAKVIVFRNVSPS